MEWWRIGVMEWWSDGLMNGDIMEKYKPCLGPTLPKVKKEKLDLYPLLNPTLHYSNTPLLQPFFFHHSTTPVLVLFQLPRMFQ
jgi:hypothetical protein